MVSVRRSRTEHFILRTTMLILISETGFQRETISG